MIKRITVKLEQMGDWLESDGINYTLEDYRKGVLKLNRVIWDAYTEDLLSDNQYSALTKLVNTKTSKYLKGAK